MQCRKCSASVDVIFMAYFLCIVDEAIEHICAFHRHEAIIFFQHNMDHMEGMMKLSSLNIHDKNAQKKGLRHALENNKHF